MKKIIQISQRLIILFFCPEIIAQTVLIPEKNISESVYLEKCRKPGYLCSHDFLAEQIKKSETVKFNQLIENLDLISDTNRINLAADIQFVLKYEMISIDQLKSFIQITEKSLSISSNKKTEFIHSQMLEILKSIESLSEFESEFVTYMVFKKRLSQKQFFKIQSLIHGVQYYKIEPDQLTENTKKPVVLLTGHCEKYQISEIFFEQFSAQPMLPVFNHECSFGAEIQKSMTHINGFVVEYKKPIVWTVLAAGLYLFTKKYDVEFK